MIRPESEVLKELKRVDKLYGQLQKLGMKSRIKERRAGIYGQRQALLWVLRRGGLR